MLGIPFHLLFIHFPIALTVMASVCDLRAHFSRRPELHRLGHTLVLWAAGGGAIAVMTGLQLLGDRNQASRATLHAALGLVSGLTLIALAMMRYSAEARSEPAESGLEMWLVLEVFATVAVIATAITGHRLVLGIAGL